MTDHSPDTIRTLLAESLNAWRIEGSVIRDADGRLIVSAGSTQVHVESAPPDIPFRWLVTCAGRRRGAASLVAVLRQVRGALDPGYEKARVRIAHSEATYGKHNQHPGGRIS